MATAWVWALSSRGEPLATKEIKKAKPSPLAIAKLESAMQRVEKSVATSGETSKVRGSIWELRVNADKRWYRLLYARADGTFVALLFVVKKRNDLDDQWIETAEARLVEHRTR